MSRAYRIRVRESLRRVLRAEDKVCTDLELLEILPAEEMGRLLAEELKRRGFQEEEDGTLVRRAKGITVTVDPSDGTVTVGATAEERVKLEGEEVGRAYDEGGAHSKQVKQALKEKLQRDLNAEAQEKEAQLQSKVTDRLEAALGELRQELDQAVNRVTAEALKRKAASMGQIKELTEDPQTGSLTIVLEV
jgi:signal transduction protein with GAF and PtsI domain